MALDTELQEDIKALKKAGFTKDEIIKNLSEKEISLDDIQENMDVVGSLPDEEVVEEQGNGVYRNLLFGLLFILLFILRMIVAQSRGKGVGGFVVIGIIIVGGIGYYLLTRKKGEK